MADPTLRVRQTLDNSQFKKGLRDSQQSAKVLSNSMKAIGGAIAGAFAVGSVINFSKESLSAYQDQIRAEAKLKTSLKGREDVFESLKRQANELQKVTFFDDEEIVSGQGTLALFVKEEEQLKRLTPLVLDLAQAKGIDLKSAAEAVGKAVNGTTRGLKAVGIEMEYTGDSASMTTAVIDQLTAAIGGQAQNALSDEEKGLRAATIAMNELKESWGQMLLSGGNNGILGWITKELDYLTWGLDKIKKEGGGFKKWWQWFWQTGEFGSDVFDAEKYGEANAEQISKNAAAIGIGGKEVKSYADMVNESLEANNKAAPVIEKTAEELEKEANAAKKAANELERLRKEYRNLQDESMRKITGGISPITTDEISGSGAIPESQQKILDAMSTVGGSRITGMQLPVEQVEEMQMALRELPGTYATVTEEMEATSQRLKSAFESIGSALGNAIGEFIKGEAKFSDVATSLIQEIIKVVAGYLTESVAASFAGGASAGGPAAAFTGAAAAAAALSMFGAIVPALMAKGGTVPGGYPNDTYPALLSSGETVLPAPHKLDAMAGAQRVIVEGRIRGQDIYFVNEKQTSKLSRYR